MSDRYERLEQIKYRIGVGSSGDRGALGLVAQEILRLEERIDGLTEQLDNLGSFVGTEYGVLRDQFAMAALTGLCLLTSPTYDKGACNAAVVERAWVLSDMMMKAREQTDDSR